MDVIHIKIPEGRGSRSHTTYRNMEDAFKNKKSIIQIKNNDNLCRSRVIITAIEHYKMHKAQPRKENQYQLCKDANTGRSKAVKMASTLEAKKLHALQHRRFFMMGMRRKRVLDQIYQKRRKMMIIFYQTERHMKLKN